jgi:EthD domain
MINKLAVFYKVDDAGVQKLRHALIDIAPQIRRRLSTATGARVSAMTLVDGAVNTTPHATSMGYTPTGLRAFVEFGYEEAPLRALIDTAAATLPPVARMGDTQASYALAGREYTFCRGEASHTLRVFMGRSLDKSFEDFHSHWLNHHGWLVKPRVDSRNGAYRQFHADPKASALAARAAGVGRHEFEGTAEAYQPDVETYLQSMSKVSSAILDDEKRFISAPDTEVGFYRIVLTLK